MGDDAQEACCLFNGSAYVEDGIVHFEPPVSQIGKAQLIHEREVFANNVFFNSSEENCVLGSSNAQDIDTVTCPSCASSTCACADSYILVGQETGPCSLFVNVVKFPIASECK